MFDGKRLLDPDDCRLIGAGGSGQWSREIGEGKRAGGVQPQSGVWERWRDSPLSVSKEKEAKIKLS